MRKCATQQQSQAHAQKDADIIEEAARILCVGSIETTSPYCCWMVTLLASLSRGPPVAAESGTMVSESTEPLLDWGEKAQGFQRLLQRKAEQWRQPLKALSC